MKLDLISIRNKLWLVAYDNSRLDDPVHVELRRNLNLMINHAHEINLVLLALTAKHVRRHVAMGTSDNKALQAAVDDAMIAASKTMVKYILWHRPFSGVALVWTLNLLSIAVSIRLVPKRTRRLVDGVIDQVAAFVKDMLNQSKQWLEHCGPGAAFGHCDTVGA
ncbi:MAG TPA: hypothetical protein DCQ98_09390 [Planctomycetaceae bacterium]|nr:hypothetical protein [Planctomycetaceae bacterium]